MGVIGEFFVDVVAKTDKVADQVTGAFDDAGEKAGSGFSSKFSGVAGKALAGLSVAGLGAGLMSIAGTFDAAFDNIRIGTGATGEALAGLQGDMKKVFASVPTDAASASTAIADLNTKLGLAGKPLQDLSTQFLNLARITGGDVATQIDVGTKAFNNFGVAAEDQGAALDTLFKVSQATGITFDDLASQVASNGAVMRQAGLSFEDTAALLGVLSKNGLAAGDVMPAFGKAMAVAAKEGKSTKDVLTDVFAAIKGAPDDTAAAGAAMEVFGAKAGPKMAGLIREGKLGYEELVATISGSGETINDVAAETADWGEKWNIIKNQILLKIEPIATALFNGIATGMELISRHQKPVLIGLGALAVVVLSALVPAFIAWASAAGAAAIATIAAAAPAIAVGVAVAGLVAGIVYAYTHFEIFRTVVDTVAQVLQVVIGGAISFVVGLFTDFGGTVDRFIAFFQSIPGRALDALSSLGSTIAGAVADAAGAVLGAVADLATSMASGLWDGLTAALSAVWQFATHVAGLVGDAASAVVSAITSLADTLVHALWDGIVLYFTTYWKLGTWIAEKIGDAVLAAVGAVTSLADKTVSALWDGIVAVWDTYWRFSGWLHDKIWDAIDTVVSTAGSVGRRLVQALWDGIVWEFNAVWDLGATIVHGLATAVDFFWDAASGIGRRLVDAIVDGIKSAPSAILDAIKGLIPGSGIIGKAAGVLGFASGGYAPEGWALVGEEGPELVQFPPGGGYVYTAAQTRGMMGRMSGLAATSSGPDLALTVNINVGHFIGDESHARELAITSSQHVARALVGARSAFDLRGAR